MTPPRRVAVIGAGISGLTAAHHLQRSGFSVIVFEMSDHVGGRVRTDWVDGVGVDAGAQLFGSMYVRFLALVREIGLGDRLVRSPGRDALWRDGRAHEVIYGSVSSMVASGGLPLRTKMRLGARYVPFLLRHAGDLDFHEPERAARAKLDGESIAAWGLREMDEAFVGSLVYPQLAAYFGSTPTETSAGFYHILASDAMDLTLYGVEGGAGLVPERLAARVATNGGEVRLGSGVTALEVGQGEVVIETESGEEAFDAAVTAVPAPGLLRIARGLPTELVEWLGGVRYQPAVCVALLLDRPVSADYFGMSFPQGETQKVVTIAIQENKGVTLVPDGRGLLLVFVTPEAAGSLVEQEAGDVLSAVLPEVARAFPGIEARVTRARVYRWPAGNPVMYPGYLGRLGTFRSSNPAGAAPIAIAGDFLYGASVEGAVSSGIDAAERIAKLFA